MKRRLFKIGQVMHASPELLAPLEGMSLISKILCGVN